MPRTDRNQVFDQDGNLISETIVEVPDPDPTAEEQAIAAIDNTTTVLGLRAVMKTYLQRKRDEG